MQIELTIKNGEVRKSTFKWNVTNLKGEMTVKLQEKWARLLTNVTFFYKLMHITRYYRQFSKQRAKEHKREELNARANLEISMASLHEDIFNEEK